MVGDLLRRSVISSTSDQKFAGSVCYLHILGQGLVFLNTPEAAIDLMDKRGTIYSDKPQLVRITRRIVLLLIFNRFDVPNLGYGWGIVGYPACVESQLLNCFALRCGCKDMVRDFGTARDVSQF
jgi:hypothetical protein